MSDTITEKAFKAVFGKFVDETNTLFEVLIGVLRSDVEKAESRARTAERDLQDGESRIRAESAAEITRLETQIKGLSEELEMAYYDIAQCGAAMKIGDVLQNNHIRDLERSNAAISQELAARTAASMRAMEGLKAAGDKVLALAQAKEHENAALRAELADFETRMVQIGNIFFKLRELAPDLQGDIVTVLRRAFGALQAEVKRLQLVELGALTLQRFNASHISLEEIQKALDRDSLDVNGPIDVG